MAALTYDQVQRTAALLSPNDQLRLVAELASRLSGRVPAPTHRSLLELRGLGKDVWVRIDPDEYIRKERASWDG